MDTNRIVVVLHIHKQTKKIDVDIPLDITANELIIGLNEAFELGMTNIEECCLKIENPIALVKGNKTLRDYGFRNGTVINYTI